MGKTEEDWNGLKLGILKTVLPNSFSKLISAVCNFKNNAQETYLFVSNLWFCHFQVICLLTLRFHSDWGRVIGKIKSAAFFKIWSPRITCHCFLVLARRMNSLVLPASFQRHYNTERFCCAPSLMSSLKSLFPGPCSFSDCQDYYGTCTVAPDGSGTAQCQCPKVEDCPSSVRELCGDDGKTYENRCRLEAESCRIKKRIEIKARGPCSKFSANLYGAFFVWPWKMVSVSVICLINRWKDQKIDSSFSRQRKP